MRTAPSSDSAPGRSAEVRDYPNMLQRSYYACCRGLGATGSSRPLVHAFLPLHRRDNLKAFKHRKHDGDRGSLPSIATRNADRPAMALH